jgi:hypothetical protein
MAQTLPESVSGDFLSARGAKVFLGDREYRAIGGNMPYAARAYIFGQDAEEKFDFIPRSPEQIEAWIAEMSESGLAFLRFFGYPNSPAEVQWYFDHKELYWERMDRFMDVCRKLNVKLVPCLGMYPHCDYNLFYAEEGTAAILDHQSRTHQLTYGYAAEMVTRYKDDPNILMWEITNEGFLKADIVMKNDPKHLITFDQFQQFYREAASWIKQHDSNHLVTSGDASPRRGSMSRRMKTPWKMDCLRDHLSNFLASHPEPLDVFSIHIYGPMKSFTGYKNREIDAEGYCLFPGDLRSNDYMKALVRTARAADTPLFIGEIGQQNPHIDVDPSGPWLREAIDWLDEEGVSLMALWVWNFPEQPNYTISREKNPEVVGRAAEFNRKYGAIAHGKELAK